MKTSEFRKYLEENWHHEETEDCFKIKGLMNVNKKNNRFEFETYMYLDGKTTKEFVNKVIEYASTPLEEREEEKKYRLKSKLFSFDLEKDMYVIKSSFYGKYCLSTNITQAFTQKEIDDMPFDTNFFIKEEVK